MKTNISKEWCRNMAILEGDAEIGIGVMAFEQGLSKEPSLSSTPSFYTDISAIAFGRFVQLMRRKNRLSLEQLAETASIDIEELVEIEDDSHHKPQVRTVYQLANVFNLPRQNLLQIAGLTAPKNDELFHEAVKFAARSNPLVELSPEERGALEAFVAVLSESK